MNEVQTLYDAFSNGGTPALAPLPMQYVDYAQWQRDADANPALAQQATYWRQRLAGTLPVIDLPTDRPRPAMQTYNGSWESRLVPESLNIALRTVSQQEGATLFMTALAAFNALLSRYTGVEDVLIGSPIAGRSREEFEPLIGYFINTLVLRTDVSGNPTFREILARVRDTALDAFAHQDVPFERIVGDLRLPRDLGRSPVFQVVFVFHNAPKSVEVKADVALTSSGGTMFDMTLSLVEVKDGLLVTAEYNTDLFDRQSIARLLASYESLLAAVVDRPRHSFAFTPPAAGIGISGAIADWAGAGGGVAGGGDGGGGDCGAGGADAGCGGGGRWDDDADVCGAGGAEHRAGAAAAGGGRRAGRAGRRVRGAVGGDGGGAAGGVEGGRGLCAAGPGVPAGAAGVHAGGCRRAGGDPGRGVGGVGAAAHGGGADPGRRGDRAAARRRRRCRRRPAATTSRM